MIKLNNAIRISSLMLLLLGLGGSHTAFAQKETSLKLFEPSENLHPWRFWSGAGAGAVTYTATMIGLNEYWYADYPRSSFHFFNDLGEWENMDKVGHAFTAYMESRWIYGGARWAGLPKRKAIWLGVAMGTLFQGSIEVLDGFSEQWGFSVPDITFNTLGCALFASQELTWGEQRLMLKVSSWSRDYPNDQVLSVSGLQSSTIETRANSLYGTAFSERFLKDYNAQTIWLSANIPSLIPATQGKLPPWLNVAVGYGAGNMYGGFDNQWMEGEALYQLDATDYPRYRQFYLSLDIDLTRIKTRSHFLKTLFGLFNVIKIPAPALEWNTLGQLRFHAIHF